MRKRDRWRNMAWIAWVDGDEKEGMCRAVRGDPEPLNKSLTALLARGKRWIEMEVVGDAFWVRVLPALFGSGARDVDYGLSYCGHDPARILDQAWRDLMILSAGSRAYSVCTREAHRWVP